MARACVGAGLRDVGGQDEARRVLVERARGSLNASADGEASGVVERVSRAPGAEDTGGLSSVLASTTIRGGKLTAGRGLGHRDVAGRASPVGRAIRANRADASAVLAQAMAGAIIAIIDAKRRDGNGGAARVALREVFAGDAGAVADARGSVADAKAAA